MTTFSAAQAASTLRKAMETHHRFAMSEQFEEQIPFLAQEIKVDGEDVLDHHPSFVPFDENFNGKLAAAVKDCGGFPIAWNGRPVEFDDYGVYSTVRGTYSKPSDKYPPMPLFIGGAVAIIKAPNGITVPVYTRTTVFTDNRGRGLNASVQFRFQTNAVRDLVHEDRLIVSAGDPIDIKAWFNDIKSVSNLLTLPWAGLSNWGIVVGLDAAPWMVGSESGFAYKKLNDSEDAARQAELSMNIINGQQGLAPLMMDAISCVVYLVPPTSPFAAESTQRIGQNTKFADSIIASGSRVIDAESVSLKARDTDRKPVGATVRMRKPAPQSK